MTLRTTPPFRADHVGSLLRPKALLDAREQFAAGKIDAAALRAVEDEAIRDVVAKQERVGLGGVTDGEFRRTYFHLDFLERIGGMETEMTGFASHFHKKDGTELDFAPPKLKTTGKLKRTRPINGEEFSFLKAAAKQTAKLSIPSPSMAHFRGGREAVDVKAYPQMGDFFTDLARVYREEIADLAGRGCRYLQLDDTNLAYLCDPDLREGARARGEDPDKLPHLYAGLINDAIRDAPADMTTAVHLCRGNFRSAFVATGGYDPVAEVLFGELNVKAFFLEYDDERSGGFSPLRYVPKDKFVVLGLVSSKTRELEPKDEIKRRLDAAAKILPLEQLCISPQCGFSSTVHGNDVSEDDQWRKLELCVKVAEEMWGA
jgi:5-methyltetrahydropteroyltriglutamate--homocysteine methyltransferase